ncbi:MAG: PH domain-containing protein [Acidobacteriota bacterium]|nr:PH domain-containing protein [Acidobacteriota bacterium]
MELRTSVKVIKFGYLLCVLLALGIAVYLLSIHNDDQRMWAWLAIPALGLIILAVRHMRRRLIKLTILDDRLRYESGVLSKSTRTMELTKIQDVRVDQTLGQRMLDIGNLSLETAGESSRIIMSSIDHPHAAADKILELSRAPRGNPPGSPAL